MPVIGNPETIDVTWTTSAGLPYNPSQIRLRYQGPGSAPTVIGPVPGGAPSNGITQDTVGHYLFTIPSQSEAGAWLYRWEALDANSNEIGAVDGSFVFTSSPFVQQPTGLPVPYGFILQNTADFQGVRDSLAFLPQELPDTLIGEPAFEPAAEAWLWKRVPNWQLLMSLAAPAAPGLAAVGDAGSALPAATYYARLVARVGGSASPPGTEASQVITAAQHLAITAPAAPGIQAYDAYVGVAAGQEFLQPATAGMAPGSTVTLSSFVLTGPPVQAVSSGDVAALKSAAVALTCAFLCRRFQRFAPARVRTLTYEEEFRHDWRVEEDRYLQDASRYVGMISTTTWRPARAMAVAHPSPLPTDPNYPPGSDPRALPPTGTWF